MAFGHLTGNNYCSLTGITDKIITIETFPLRLFAGEGLFSDNLRCLVAGQRTIKLAGYQSRPLFVGVDAVRIIIGMRLQKCVKIHNRQVALLCNTAYHGDDTICNYTVVDAEIPFHSRHREAQIYLRLGRQVLKNIQHLRQVLSEILSVMPVPRLAVICSQFNGNDVWLKCQQIAEFLLVHVRMISLVQHYAGADSEVTHIVPLTQKLGEQSRITVLKLIFNS